MDNVYREIERFSTISRMDFVNAIGRAAIVHGYLDFWCGHHVGDMFDTLDRV